jgi:hypothetical protein
MMNWKAVLNNNPSIFLELKTPWKTCQNSQSPDKNENPGPPEYEAGLPTMMYGKYSLQVS